MKLSDVQPGDVFRYCYDHKPDENGNLRVMTTLPLFAKLEGREVLNLASGAIFTIIGDEPVVLEGERP